MHHAAAKNFHPAVAGADLDRLTLAGIFHVHLGRRFRERKEVRAEAGFDTVDFKEGAHEVDEAAFQVPHMRALLDDEAFDLVEHRRVRRVPVIAVDPARHENADRRLLVHHGADLHG